MVIVNPGFRKFKANIKQLGMDCIGDFLEISCPPAYNGNHYDMTGKNWKDDVLSPSPLSQQMSPYERSLLLAFQ